MVTADALLIPSVALLFVLSLPDHHSPESFPPSYNAILLSTSTEQRNIREKPSRVLSSAG